MFCLRDQAEERLHKFQLPMYPCGPRELERDVKIHSAQSLSAKIDYSQVRMQTRTHRYRPIRKVDGGEQANLLGVSLQTQLSLRWTSSSLRNLRDVRLLRVPNPNVRWRCTGFEFQFLRNPLQENFRAIDK